MAGPNYDVGITFLAKGDLGKVLATLNAQMKELAANAVVVSAAMSNAVVSAAKKESAALSKVANVKKNAAVQEIAATKIKGEAQRVADAQALAATKIKGESQKAADAQALAAVKIKGESQKAADAQALAATKIKGEAQRVADTQALAATRAQEAANAKVAAAKEVQIKRASMLLRKKRAGEREAEIATKRHISSIGHALKSSGIYGGGRISSVLGMTASPLAIGLTAVAAALVISTYGANEYAKALLSIETSGIGAAQAQKELAQALGARSGSLGLMAPTTAGTMIGYLNAVFPKTDIKGNSSLMSTAAAATEVFHAGYGQTQVEASSEVMHIVESIKRGLSASGVNEAAAYKQTPGILSAVMANATTMGPYTQKYLEATTNVLNDPLLMNKMGSKNLPGYLSNMRALVAGGATGSNLDEISRVFGVGGISKDILLPMMAQGAAIKVGGMSEVLARRTFGLGDPAAAELARTKPYDFVNEYLYKGVTGKTLNEAAKLPEGQHAALNEKALGAYAPGSAAYTAIQSAISAYGFNDKNPNANWPELVNPLTASMDRLNASTTRLAIATESQVGVKLANAASWVLDKASDSISAENDRVTRSTARTDNFGNMVEYFFGSPQQNTQSPMGGAAGNIVIHAKNVDVKGSGRQRAASPNSVYNQAGAGGSNISTYQTGQH